MDPVDSIFMNFSIVGNFLSLLGFGTTWETSGVVRDVEAPVAGAFEGAENSGASGGSGKADV